MSFAHVIAFTVLVVDDSAVFFVLQKFLCFFNGFCERDSVVIPCCQQNRFVDLVDIFVDGAAFCRNAALLQISNDIVDTSNVTCIRGTHQIFINQKGLHFLICLAPFALNLCHNLTAFRCHYYTILKCIFQCKKIEFFGGFGFTNQEKCDIMIEPNKKQIFSKGNSLFL